MTPPPFPDARRLFEEVTARIRRSTEWMRRTLDDMVDFAFSRRGRRIQLRPQALELSRVVGQVLEELESEHPRRILVRERLEQVRGDWDPDRLEQVVSTLMGNALQHSPPESPVTVRLWREERLAVLEIHNEGRPISPEDQQTLFAPFRPGSEVQSAQRVGLGLYVTDQLVLAHQGKLSVRSTAAQGTTFRVELPLPPAEAKP